MHMEMGMEMGMEQKTLESAANGGCD